MKYIKEQAALSHVMSSTIQKCTKMQWKYVSLRNACLAEIFNNPAIFLFIYLFIYLCY